MKALHKVADITLLGLRSLTVHKVRSALTALGILFGVWSVIAMLGISEGASYQSQLSLREMGSNNIIIRSAKPPESSGANDQKRGMLAYGLTRQDISTLVSNVPGVVRSAMVHESRRLAYAEGRKEPCTLLGTEASYASVVRVDLVSGRFLHSADTLRRAPHCLITQGLANKLFSYKEPLGKTVCVDNEPLLIVGVLESLPRAMIEGVLDPDSCVLVPLTTDIAMFGEMNVFFSQGSATFEKVAVSHFIMQMQDEKAVEEGSAVVRSLLERRHAKQDYKVKVPRELLEQMKKQARLWSIVFMAIASVSLLVGGIGIMNIMLASVTERTREIGIRRALGAKRGDIVVQFLIEAVTLTMLGGLVGIIVGELVPWVVEKTLGLKAIISASTLLLPFVMAVVVGLISGLYPAFRAARLDPITALRHE